MDTVPAQWWHGAGHGLLIGGALAASVLSPVHAAMYVLAWVVAARCSPRRWSTDLVAALVASFTVAVALAPSVAHCVLARPDLGLASALLGGGLAGTWLALHVGVTTLAARRYGPSRHGWLVVAVIAALTDHLLRWCTPWGPTGATASLTLVASVARWGLPWLGASGLVGLLVGLATLTNAGNPSRRVRGAALAILLVVILPAPDRRAGDGPVLALHGLRPSVDWADTPSRARLSLWAGTTAKLAPGPDWVLWPEGAIPHVQLTGPRLERVQDAAAAIDAVVFVGAAGRDRRVDVRRNRLFVVPPTGTPHVYGKRTPFPIVEGIDPESLGDVVVDVEGIAALLSLCFEGSLVEQESASTAGVHVNLASDVWLAGSPFARLHAAMVVVRSLELSLPTVRHSDVGPSVVVDARGVRWHRAGQPLIDSIAVEHQQYSTVTSR